jgi:hypothetical protein
VPLYKTARETNDWPGASVKAAFLKSTYSFDFDSHTLWSHVSGHEVSGTGYTSGGKPLLNKTSVWVGTEVRHDADDTDFGVLTLTDVRYVVVYNSTTNQLIQLFALDAPYSPVATEVTVKWPSGYLWRERVVNNVPV